MLKNIVIAIAIGSALTSVSASAIAECAAPKVTIEVNKSVDLKSDSEVSGTTVLDKCQNHLDLEGYYTFKYMGKVITQDYRPIRIVKDHSQPIEKGAAKDEDSYKRHEEKLPFKSYWGLITDQTGSYTVTYSVKNIASKKVLASASEDYSVTGDELPKLVSTNPSPSFKGGSNLLLFSSNTPTGCQISTNENIAKRANECYFKAIKDGEPLVSWVTGANVFVKIPAGTVGDSYTFDWEISKYKPRPNSNNNYETLNVMLAGVQTVEYVENAP